MWHARDETLMGEVKKEKLPETLEPEIGQMLESINSDGSKQTVIITDVSESAVTLDANHPLAGKDLVFETELLEIA